MMKTRAILFTATLLFSSLVAYEQQSASVKEYKKVFKTYPFSDPDPVPDATKIYPYYRFDGYAENPVNKEWQVVELENDYIKVIVLPEIGGKIWAAIEKTTGKSFIYYNQVVKFRDVAMRGPWTSGGLEPNYGIVGHTPNCATPVDYTVIKKPDGSVSCVVGVLDLLTRSVWRLDINLEKDKAYFTTSSTWYNASPFEQPYYHWMNGALKASNDLQFIFPGTKYIGHGGEHSPWPIDEKGRDLSWYRNNDFGSYKSYHVFGKHSNFWGSYYHDEDFGMGRYSTYDDKAGKKIWIWGLSREGMIWEKLLTDNDGQYVEVQSGRLFNQPSDGSSFTPFKNRGFTPHTTDKWKEYWFPVMKTKGFVTASQFGSLNVKEQNGHIVVHLSPVQSINDELKIYDGSKVLYTKKLSLKPLELFKDSIQSQGAKNLRVELGNNKMVYDAAPNAGNISRPFESPASFDWKSVQGLHLQGKEFIRQRMYTPAEEKLGAALKTDSNYLPALSDYALLMYRQMKYDEALAAARKALSIDAYDPAANYYYGLINERTGKTIDAKDGYDMASQSVEFRSPSFTRLATIHFKENDFEKTVLYSLRAIEANKSAIDAYQLLAVAHRLQKNKEAATKILDTLAQIDPLNHLVNFEKYLWDGSEKSKQHFVGMIRNEMPEQTFLELAAWYYGAGRNEDALKVLELSKPNAERAYWMAFLNNKAVDDASLQPGLVFPFRHETAEVLNQLIPKNNHWVLKYHLALIRWNANDIATAQKLLSECGDQPNYAPFYVVRARVNMKTDSTTALADLKKAVSIDKSWRYNKSLAEYYMAKNNVADAMPIVESEYKKNRSNYVAGMMYAQALIANKNYAQADKVLQGLNVLPNEGATGGRKLYRETKLMLAVQAIKSNNCKKALQYITQSKEWPEGLGSGKPYEADIDERVEDWLSYKCLTKSKNTQQARQMLEKIAAYTSSLDGSKRPNVSHLVSAMALRELGKTDEAKAFLEQIVQKHPNNATAKWAQSVFNGDSTNIPAQVSGNENYIILKEAGAL